MHKCCTVATFCCKEHEQRTLSADASTLSSIVFLHVSSQEEGRMINFWRLPGRTRTGGLLAWMCHASGAPKWAEQLCGSLPAESWELAGKSLRELFRPEGLSHTLEAVRLRAPRERLKARCSDRATTRRCEQDRVASTDACSIFCVC